MRDHLLLVNSKPGGNGNLGKPARDAKGGLFADGCRAAEAKRAKTQRTAAAFPTLGQGNGSAVRLPMTQPLISFVTGAQIDPGVPEWQRGEPAETLGATLSWAPTARRLTSSKVAVAMR